MIQAQGIQKVLESRRPARGFKVFRESLGDVEAFCSLNGYLGDFPEGIKIRRAAAALNLPVYDLNSMANSADDSERRVSRLILLEGFSAARDGAQLQKGLTDSYALIRSDTARLTETGADRTRIYNQLIRLIREDPDIRVRRASGKRLAGSFADLYAVDFDGLPPLSRMMILDAMEGHSRVEEERAESLLMNEDAETSFRAARCLLRWGTLEQLFISGGNDAVLLRAARNGVVDYLERVSINPGNRPPAVVLAETAGRTDLVRRLQSEVPGFSGENSKDFMHAETIVMNLAGLKENDRLNRIAALDTESEDFRKSLELFFPPPDTDIISGIIFEIARKGKWKEWSGRVIKALSSDDPDIRKSAVLSIAGIARDDAERVLAPMLSDPVDRVRNAAAGELASLPDGEGYAALLEFISNEPDQEFSGPVYEGIRCAGGTVTAQLILYNQAQMGVDASGDLLSRGIDAAGVQLLAGGIADEEILKMIMTRAGASAGESAVSAWRTLDADARKRLLPSVRASGWAESVILSLESDKGADSKKYRDLIGYLDAHEREFLFKPLMEKTDNRGRRLVRKIMKS
jgi:hypothetical protein